MAARSYGEAIRRVLAHEGGYANHPSDPGGPTKYGITLATYRKYGGKPQATAVDVKAMPLETAKAIYRRAYWDAIKGDDLAAGVDYAVFDYAVNSGTGRAARVLRHLVGAPAGATVDRATLERAAAREARALVGAICDERLAFLKRLGTWRVFGAGWGRRVADVRKAALTMTAAPAAAAADHDAVAPAMPGKGVAPVNGAAQKGAAGAVVVGGAIAAERAANAGASASVILAIMAASALLAVAAWLFWRWRAQRMQARVIA